MSALYPAPSPAAVTWLTTLRAALASLGNQVPRASPTDVETLAAQLESDSPEAAELGDRLRAMLEEFGGVIGGLAAAFGLPPSTMLIALGRGEEIGEIDPIVAEKLAEVADLRPLTSSGTVTIEKDGRSTTLIAATTVTAAVGPVRIPWPDRDDVWLCAVPAGTAPGAAAQGVQATQRAQAARATQAALERILPHIGVIRAHIRTTPATTTAPHRFREPDDRPAVLQVSLLMIDRTADPDLVMARLEGWRAALEQLHRGTVAILWRQV